MLTLAMSSTSPSSSKVIVDMADDSEVNAPFVAVT
ncbi:unnamed protein product, partial [Plutella xylostella]